MKTDEYKCSICGNIYEKSWSDKESEKELKEKFGENATVEDSEIVCDDCYKNLFN